MKSKPIRATMCTIRNHYRHTNQTVNFFRTQLTENTNERIEHFSGVYFALYLRQYE